MPKLHLEESGDSLNYKTRYMIPLNAWTKSICFVSKLPATHQRGTPFFFSFFLVPLMKDKFFLEY